MSSPDPKSDQSSPLQSPGSVSQLSPGADAAHRKKELLKEKEKEKEKERHHLRTNVNEALLGAHSPASIPSSPASIRSISSAIFERDIESSHLSPTHPSDPHRIPRARSTEQLEHAVPSVLDSAAAVLASIKDEGEGEVEVVSPDSAAGGRGFASFNMRSRSPSPTPAAIGGVSPHILSSPGIASKSSATSLSPTSPKSTLSPSSTSISCSSTSPSQKRLSFISYSDLLSSTPATSHPLSSLTSSPPEPPHIPTVTQIALTPQGSRAPSIRGRKGDSGSVIGDDVGGEWEREGLGRGLEERLEEVVGDVGIEREREEKGRE